MIQPNRSGRDTVERVPTDARWHRRLSALAFRRALLCTALAAAMSLASLAEADDGYWITTGGGSWANASNWDPANGIADGTDFTAYFDFDQI